MSQIRFNEARERLANGLQNLEEIIAKKIRETSIDAKMLNAADSDEAQLHSQLAEQLSINQTLGEELNKAQKMMEEIGQENEFLKEKNQLLADKIFKFKSQGTNLVQAVESDLATIHTIINQK